jgi:hypothetical protein
MSKSEHDAVVRGRAAWERLKDGRSWDDWMMTGEAVLIGRSECLGATHTNDLNSKRYRDAFSEWMEVNGFGEMDKGERARLFECLDNRAAIEAWRATLTGPERRRLNHPQSVLRRWRARTVEGRATVTSDRPSKNQIIAAQEERIDELEAQTSKVPGDQYDLKTTNPSEIARIIIEATTLDRVEALIKQLDRLVKSVKRIGADQGEATPSRRQRRHNAINGPATLADDIRQLRHDHPEWSIETLAARVNRAPSYVREVLDHPGEAGDENPPR